MSEPAVDCEGEEYHPEAPHPVYGEYTSASGVREPRIFLPKSACRKLGLDVGGEYRIEPHEDGILITTERSRSENRSSGPELTN